MPANTCTTADVTMEGIMAAVEKLRALPDFVVEVRCDRRTIAELRLQCPQVPAMPGELFGIRIVESDLWPYPCWEAIYRSGKSELHTPYGTFEREPINSGRAASKGGECQ